MSLETEPKPNVKQAVPFFAVSDIEASVRFYADGLGFRMMAKWIVAGKLRWCRLERGGAALMLQEFRREGHDSWKSGGRLGEGVMICFICEDALAIYREVRSRGIRASRPFVGNAMWATSLSDLDGYRIDFESDTDLPAADWNRATDCPGWSVKDVAAHLCRVGSRHRLEERGMG